MDSAWGRRHTLSFSSSIVWNGGDGGLKPAGASAWGAVTVETSYLDGGGGHLAGLVEVQ